MHESQSPLQTDILLTTSHNALSHAGDLLEQQQLIVAPTDTVYGVMGHYASQVAIEQLYAVKRRPRHKAIPILVAGREQLNHIVQPPLPAQTHALVEHFWPGPLTLIVPAHPSLLPILTAGQPTVAVRMPDHAWLLSLIERTGPLAATSANRSGEADALTAAQAAAALAGEVPLLIDGGPVAGGTSSTIVDLTTSSPTVLRPGPIQDAVLRKLQSNIEQG